MEEKGKWIWIDNRIVPDTYVRFSKKFNLENTNGLSLSLSCDSIYNFYLNGKFVGFGMMHDFEHYKMKDEYKLSDYAVKGENELQVLVWYHGTDANSYRANEPGLWFEIKQENNYVAVSNETTFAKYEEGYYQSQKKFLTVAIGYTYKFDNGVKAIKNEYDYSVVVDKKVTFADFNAKNLTLCDFVPAKPVKNTGKSVIYDLGKECFGYLSFDIVSETVNNNIKIVFGEHIRRGHLVERFNNSPVINYLVEYVAREGKNSFSNFLRALGCRYLEVFSDEKIAVESIGITPLRYPFTVRPFTLKDELDQKIYDTAVYTLYCCAYKHYIDCPWREQGAYIFDSRNQMLAGYSAFTNTELQRYNLLFFSKGLNSSGLLPCCMPNHSDGAIPFFDLVYFMMASEYVEHTGDSSVVPEILPVLEAVLKKFNKGYASGKAKDCELIKRFDNPYWNFYEWTENNDHWLEYYSPAVYDLVLNCAFVIAIECYQKLLATQNKTLDFDFNAYRKIIHDAFYVKETGLVKNDTKSCTYSKMGNGIAILAGVFSEKESKSVAKKLISDDGITDISLSAISFYYDALLKVDKNYSSYIINDIREKYKSMLDRGATTFWETIDGQDDFGGSGSLCHGWSALPIYYYDLLKDDLNL